jgi:hypothetical protein
VWSRSYRALLALAVVVVVVAAVPARATANEHCAQQVDTGGELSDQGRLDIILESSESCGQQENGASGYPRRFWTTQDIFWGSEAGCPAGETDGIRRYWSVPAPGADPVLLYDAPACVPIPDNPDDLDLDSRDIEAILRGYLPRPSVARDPYVDGLVNLETYFWYDGDPLTDVDHDREPATPPRPGWQATVTHQGITITATLHVERFTWQVAPGETVSATVPGSPDDPAASHTYRSTGTYELVASTTWAGDYTWSIGGLNGSGTLGAVTLDSPPDPFRVREVRAVPAQPDP